MRIEWQPRALKDLSRLDKAARARISAALDRLAATGHGDVTKLTDVDPPEYRLRVGNWRVRFARDPAADTLSVLRILPRDKAY
ncbi:MAG: type II toxin-antitoxin system RelE/ParE family toxin [Gemmatimonadetes bacterium]|nr:type II toxin-antitoxin system RelE/ParE family toxin [Gemmatimonadota bacterium]